MACLSMVLGTGGAAAPLPGPSTAQLSAAAGNVSTVPSRASPVLTSSGDGGGMSDEAMAVVHPAAANANLMWIGKPTNVSIVVNENEQPDSIVRRFRREVMSEGIIAECRHRRYFETPQEMKKRKEQALQRRRKMSRRGGRGGGAFGAAPGPMVGGGRGGGGFGAGPSVGGFRPDAFAPKPAKTKEEDDADFWGDDADEVIFK